MSATRDRWYVDLDKHEAFGAMARGDEAVFATIKDVFVLSAAYGYHVGARMPIAGERRHTGFWAAFTEARDVPMLQAIAIAETGGLEILDDRGALLTIVEEYANGGFSHLMDLDRHEMEETLRAVAVEVVSKGSEDIS